MTKRISNPPPPTIKPPYPSSPESKIAHLERVNDGLTNSNYPILTRIQQLMKSKRCSQKREVKNEKHKRQFVSYAG